MFTVDKNGVPVKLNKSSKTILKAKESNKDLFKNIDAIWNKYDIDKNGVLD